MDELDLLERVRADVEIDPAALLRARRRVLRQAVAPALRRRGTGRRRTARRVVSVVAVAAAMAALAVLVLPGPQGAEPAAAAVLSRAARVAAAEQVAGPGEWLHVRLETTRDGTTRLQERWVPGDPSKSVHFLDSGQRWSSPVDRPAIYTDEDASVDDLYAWLSRDSGDLRGDDAAFERAGEVMFDSTAPAAFKSRLLEAVALIDGVHVVADQTRFVFDAGTGVLLGVEGISDTATLSYTTLFTSNVVDTLPRRAAP